MNCPTQTVVSRCLATRVHSSRRGLSLAETLISVAIAATLLVATAVAFEAASDAVSVNERLFEVTRTARVAMNRVITEARRGAATQVVDVNTLDVVSTGGLYQRYKYFPDTKELKVITPDIPDDRDYVLAREVSACNFTKDEDTDPVSGLTRVTRIAVDLTVAVDNTSVHLSGAVAPRRNRSY